VFVNPDAEDQIITVTECPMFVNPDAEDQIIM
jgi:hypothetical protein